MHSVACKQFGKGKDIEETAKITQHPLNVVQAWYREYKESRMSNLSVCGTDCSTCYCFGKMCTGCNDCEGKVFHVPEGKACAIYDCVIHCKGLKNCGECKNAPCDIWMNTRDPKFSDKEFEENVKMRIQTLKNE